MLELINPYICMIKALSMGATHFRIRQYRWRNDLVWPKSLLRVDEGRKNPSSLENGGVSSATSKRENGREN